MKKTQNLEPFPMEFLIPSKRVHLGEVNKKRFNECNKIDLQTNYCQIFVNQLFADNRVVNHFSNYRQQLYDNCI